MKVITSIYITIILIELSCGYVDENPRKMKKSSGKELFIKTMASLSSAISSNAEKLTEILEIIKGVPTANIDSKNDLYDASLAGESSYTLATDCFDLYKLGMVSSTYWLHKFKRPVLCDMETDGGGWLVIQKRQKIQEQVNFNQNWSKYKSGFGNINTEFWIGNDMLHLLTNQKQYELLIEMDIYGKGPVYAKYSSFRVGNEASFYYLSLGSFTGNSTDSFSSHHGRTFSTADRDSDLIKGNCAEKYTGGWWFTKCYDAHLNGIYPTVIDTKNGTLLTWWGESFNPSYYNRSDSRWNIFPQLVTEVSLKIRPVHREE